MHGLAAAIVPSAAAEEAETTGKLFQEAPGTQRHRAALPGAFPSKLSMAHSALPRHCILLRMISGRSKHPTELLIPVCRVPTHQTPCSTSSHAQSKCCLSQTSLLFPPSPCPFLLGTWSTFPPAFHVPPPPPSSSFSLVLYMRVQEIIAGIHGTGTTLSREGLSTRAHLPG